MYLLFFHLAPKLITWNDGGLLVCKLDESSKVGKYEQGKLMPLTVHLFVTDELLLITVSTNTPKHTHSLAQTKRCTNALSKLRLKHVHSHCLVLEEIQPSHNDSFTVWQADFPLSKGQSNQPKHLLKSKHFLTGRERALEKEMVGLSNKIWKERSRRRNGSQIRSH